MRVPLLAVLSCVPLECYGFHSKHSATAGGDAVSMTTDDPADPEEPAKVKPVGRHIQYYHQRDKPGKGGGLSDRMYMFSWLLNLAKMNNATVHISGGVMGAPKYLGWHSQKVQGNWFHYLGVTPECGQHPFHECVDFEGCRNILWNRFNFSNPLFEGENGCVNVMRLYNYAPQTRRLPVEKTKSCTIGYAPEIRKRSLKVLEDLNVPKRFGGYHIRRCDRVFGNVVCTNPIAVASMINSFPDTDTWMIFHYTEEGYIWKLKETLRLYAPNKTVMFEEDLKLSPYNDGDNFYTYLVVSDILNLATVRVDTHVCKHNNPLVERKPIPASRLDSRTELFDANAALEEEELSSPADAEFFDDGDRSQVEEQDSMDMDLESQVFGTCGGGQDD